MGGGGGSSRFNSDDVKELLRKAKEKLDKAKEGRRNVFLSFAVEDVAEVNLLRGQSKNEHSEIEFNDWSVKDPYDSKRADYIKERIRERIEQSSVTVVYLSPATSSSDWVNWEIAESLRLGKAVIGVHKGDVGPAQLPRLFVEHQLRVVPWSRLSDALR